MVINI